MSTNYEWQPIETAPKDVTTIRLFDPEMYSVFNPCGHDGWWDSRKGWVGFVWVDTPRDVMVSKLSPTHWMHMPDPPNLG